MLSRETAEGEDLRGGASVGEEIELLFEFLGKGLWIGESKILELG